MDKLVEWLIWEVLYMQAYAPAFRLNMTHLEERLAIYIVQFSHHQCLIVCVCVCWCVCVCVVVCACVCAGVCVWGGGSFSGRPRLRPRAGLSRVSEREDQEQGSVEYLRGK